MLIAVAYAHVLLELAAAALAVAVAVRLLISPARDLLGGRARRCRLPDRRAEVIAVDHRPANEAEHAGRETDLRPDWEQVKFEVMLHALRGKFTLEPHRSALLLTQPRPLAEDSPSDFVWGARGSDGGYGGQNLLGLALMRVRDELIADVRTRVSALAPGR